MSLVSIFIDTRSLQLDIWRIDKMYEGFANLRVRDYPISQCNVRTVAQIPPACQIVGKGANRSGTREKPERLKQKRRCIFASESTHTKRSLHDDILATNRLYSICNIAL